MLCNPQICGNMPQWNLLKDVRIFLDKVGVSCSGILIEHGSFLSHFR